MPGLTVPLLGAWQVNCSNHNASHSIWTSSPHFFQPGESQLSSSVTFELAADETHHVVNVPHNFGFREGWAVGFDISMERGVRLHHLVGYACVSPLDEGLEPLRHAAEGGHKTREGLGCSYPLLAWSHGMDSLVLPPDVSLPLGAANGVPALLFELSLGGHATESGVPDIVTVHIRYTDASRQHDMGVLQLGNRRLAGLPWLPAGEEAYHVSSRCLVESSENVQLFASMPHMHGVGSSIWSEKIATGGVMSAGEVTFSAAAAPGAPLESLATPAGLAFDMYMAVSA